MYQLRTIDVWDTLLRRRCHPDLIKLATARHLVFAYHEDLDPEYLDHWAVLRERCSVEAVLGSEARKAGDDDEYRLSDVLDRLLERVFAHGDQDHSATVQSLIQVELENERRHTYPDARCRDLIGRYPAKKTLFLSDFYMPAKMLMQLIEFHGMHDLVPDGISSCDVMLNKRSGRLYRYVHAHHAVEPSAHVHIGDNAYSDVEVPARLGVKAVHYSPEEEKQTRRLQEKCFSDRAFLFRLIEKRVLEAAAINRNARTTQEDMIFRLGIRAAPLFIGFGLSIAERSIVDKVRRLFFFTREGEFFLKVFDVVSRGRRLANQDVPEARLLEISRVATFCASLRSVSIDEMMRLWTLYDNQSMYALSRSLGMDPAALAGLCMRHSIAPTETIAHPWQDERVRRLFADEEFKQVVGEKVHSDRRALLAYLSERGIREDQEYIGVVDIGWRGTIQDNLAWLLPQKRISGYYLGLQRFLNQQPPNCSKRAYGPDANLDLGFSHLLDAVSPIEMLCNSPSGSVMGYRLEARGRAVADRLIEPAENAVYANTVRHFQDGVLFACDHWAPYIENHAICSKELRELACNIWNALIVKPERQISQAYAALSHNEVFGVGCFVDKRIVPTPEQMIKSLLSPKARRDVILYIKQTQWTSGLWHRSDLSVLHRGMLVSALVAGKAYKRLRLWTRHYLAR